MAEKDEVIMVALDKYSDLFSEWTPAPFKLREIDPDLRALLEEKLTTIAFSKSIVLRFTIPSRKKMPGKEGAVVSELRRNFLTLRQQNQERILAARRRAGRYAFLSISIIALAYFLSHVLPPNLVLSVVNEGLFIGGWVFMWEAISTVLIRSRDWRAKMRTYERLAHATIEFEVARRAPR